ncbi:phosphoesterase-domain-containing protein [Backusella circina FSU 941]|nr:phosphoesterase-domain-containing protein [Backusella circina FSU 941]
MHIPVQSLFAIAALASVVSAKSIHQQESHSSHSNTHKAPKAPKGKAFDHFIQIWFENMDFETVNNNSDFRSLVKEGILLDNYNAITHPSEPNYVAVAGGSNFGIDNDDYYNIPANISSIYDLLEKKGLTWKVYQEDIPSVGFTGYLEGEYVRKHNPAIIFDSVGLNETRRQNVVGDDQFQKDVKSGNLPNWMFYTPNMLNDGHDTNVSYAGNWLKTFYKDSIKGKSIDKNAVILITFDENKTYPSRNRVWSLLLGNIPKELKGTTDNTFYTHYSTLSTVEHNWDLGNLGRQDTNKTVSNVLEFTAKKLHYTNVHVPESEIPWNNNTIPGLLTGKSYNETHTK